MPELKLCKDCIHCQELNGGNNGNCLHPVAIIKTNVVSGRHMFQTCADMRHHKECGESANLFEKRLTYTDKAKALAERLFGKYYN